MASKDKGTTVNLLRGPLLSVGRKAETAEYDTSLCRSLVGLDCLKAGIDLGQSRT